MLCTVQAGTWRGSLPQRACNVNRKIRESWQAKKEICAEGTQLAWSSRQRMRTAAKPFWSRFSAPKRTILFWTNFGSILMGMKEFSNWFQLEHCLPLAIKGQEEKGQTFLYWGITVPVIMGNSSHTQHFSLAYPLPWITIYLLRKVVLILSD